MAINIEFSSGFNREFYDRDAWTWGTSKLERKGKDDAKNLMKQWGLGYGSGGNIIIPYGVVRKKSSPQYVPCEDLENILLQSTNNYDKFYKEREAACKTCRRAKRNKKINMYKWAYLRDWARGATISQSEINKYNTCEEEGYEKEEQEALDYGEALLDEDKVSEFKGLSNLAVAGFVGGIGLVLTLVLIKASK